MLTRLLLVAIVSYLFGALSCGAAIMLGQRLRRGRGDTGEQPRPREAEFDALLAELMRARSAEGRLGVVRRRPRRSSGQHQMS